MKIAIYFYFSDLFIIRVHSTSLQMCVGCFPRSSKLFNRDIFAKTVALDDRCACISNKYVKEVGGV